MWRSGRKPPKWASKDSAEGGGIEDCPLMRAGVGRVGIEKTGMARGGWAKYVAYPGRRIEDAIDPAYGLACATWPTKHIQP